MTWPTLEQVEAADATWLRIWLNELPGTDQPDQIAILRRICARIVAGWSPMLRPIPAAPAPPEARPRPAPKRPTKPQPEPSGLDLFKAAFARP